MTAFIWNMLFDGRVLETIQTASHPGIRMYAHCSSPQSGRTSIVAVLINISLRDQVNVSLSLVSSSSDNLLGPRREYVYNFRPQKAYPNQYQPSLMPIDDPNG